jgi:hypothetical protein
LPLSPPVVYTVTAEVAAAGTLDAWLAWLPAHVQAVLAAGAQAAELSRLDGGPPFRAQVRYRFADRDAFAAYERDHAPRLRAEGLAAFPPSRGLTLSRTLAEVVLDLPPG